MFIISILLLIINIIIISFLIIKKNKIKRKIKERAENEIKEEIKYKQEEKERKIYDINNDILREEKRRNLILNQKTEIIDKELELYKNNKINILDNEYKEKENLLKEKLKSFEQNCTDQKEKYNFEIEKYKLQLEDFKKRIESANQEILRKKEIEEKEDFYKINISENDIDDIKIFKNIEPNIKNKEVLNKVIYDAFIKKPALEMIKRVLNGNSPSGIYRITYLPTGEAYIGKSTNINKRWQEHLKSAYGLGTIAHSSLHTKMAKEGVWNFSFEMIEEVPKEQLTEREKYWINFYDTKKYGLNEREG